MQTSDFRKPGTISAMKFSLREMPHGTVETNRTCNMRCTYCYNLDHESVKPLSGILSEIDLLMEKRNPQAITILGGEPTLHPDLAKVVEYVKSKNVLCQLLTNGLLFLAPNGERLVDHLIASGVDRITLHVDHGQSLVHHDIEETRLALCTMLEKKKIHFSLSITIDAGEIGSIPEIIGRFARFRYFDGVLGIVAKNPLDPQRPTPRLEDVYKNIAEGLSIEPSTYIPSNQSDQDVRWLIYYYFINATSGRTFSISSGVFRIVRTLYRLFTGRHLFILKLPPALMDAFRLHYIAIQVPPEFNESTKTFTMCHHCPDATVRNGMIIPVCIADQMSPLAGSGIAGSPEPERYEAVREHLSEETVSAHSTPY
jgi:hypothetical protein